MRHGVVHERCRDQLPGGVELDVLHESLADALRYAAVHLTVQQQRVENCPKIIDDAVTRYVDLAGLAIDLKFTDVTSVRIVVHRCLIDRSCEQTGLHAAWEVCGVK